MIIESQYAGPTMSPTTKQFKENEQSLKRPNIVLLFSDQQRWDTLGCYGQALPIIASARENIAI